MTELLEKAFQEASKLPELEQNQIAAWILEMLNAEDESQWDAEFAATQDVLADLADEALSELLSGDTEELNPDTL